jgi:hypothetical protein
MSSVGGILGLMVGCSLLSFIEFAYFIGIRSVSDHLNAKRQQNRIVPMAAKSSVKAQSKLQSFLFEYLNASTVHAASYIAKRNWFEK